MKKNNGITLIEGLVAIAVIALVLVICVIALYGANKESRDVKRASDMEILRSAMSLVKIQFGSYAESGCQLGAVYLCRDNNLAQVMPTVVNFHDPQAKTLCSQACVGGCDYSFTEIEDESFEVLFYLEKGVGNFVKEGCYALTENGVIKK